MVYNLNYFPNSSLFFFNNVTCNFSVMFHLIREGECMLCMARVEIKGQLSELWSLLLHVGPWDRWKCLYLLSHLTLICLISSGYGEDRVARG